MTGPLTDAELAKIADEAGFILRAGFHSAPVVRMLAVSLPRLIDELLVSRFTIRYNADASKQLLDEMSSQLAARDAQVARLRQVVEDGAEVIT